MATGKMELEERGVLALINVTYCNDNSNDHNYALLELLY